MRPHEGRLSGYLLARAAMGQKIDDSPQIRKLPNGRALQSEYVLKDLRAANDTVEETRRLLPNGRGNVKEDILATGGEASRRYAAGSYITNEFLKQKGLKADSDPRYSMQVQTAVSLFTGEATCGGSALLAAHMHAPKLKQGQVVAAIADVQVDHMWTETRRADGDRTQDPILDRWASGPAVLREDSKFGQNPNPTEAYALYGSNRDNAIRKVQMNLNDIRKDHGLQANFQAAMTELEQMDYKFMGKIWDEESVMSGTFHGKAGETLHPDSSLLANSEKFLGTDKPVPTLPFTQEILAA
ncbi:MAG TPA: hypothetical protein VK465_11435, partial [Fibrobacteria bacterium]|nr:hypothetical protein [Fibrobacteria bacterium]